MKVNKYGLNIKGLKKVSGETENYRCYSPAYNEIFYNMESGELWSKYQYSLGQNWWTQYDDGNIIKVCNTQKHLTMQELADRVAEAVQIHNMAVMA